ncbi:MAG: SRPBCC family protein [Leucobacter sp.]|nr:SRPBCC family protein [Leucobacter sp.]
MSRAASSQRDRALYVEIFIDAPIDRVWELTQDPDNHARWDGRFSAIRPTVARADGSQEFRYELGLGVHTIRGTGVSLGEKRAAGGARTSALIFTTEDRLSPLGTGRGYWRYIPEADGVRFITGYDYEPGWGWPGKLVDPLVTRRFVWWLTAWSFDRLRIWAEDGTAPERVGWWRGWFGGVRARASNCRSRPAGTQPRDSFKARVMDAAPDTLARLSPPETREKPVR